MFEFLSKTAEEACAVELQKNINRKQGNISNQQK